jgi:hypothetical protein
MSQSFSRFAFLLTCPRDTFSASKEKKRKDDFFFLPIERKYHPSISRE